MSRIISYIILVILALWLFDTFLKSIKGYFRFQSDKATKEMNKPHKVSKKRKIARIIAVILMISGGLGFFISLFFYFTGDTFIPFKKGIIVSVVVFFISYIWYSDKLQSGK